MGKYWILRIGLFLSFGILLTSVWKLTVIKGKYYSNLARENKIMETSIPAPRGQILDRKGRVIAKTVYYYNDLGFSDFKGYKFDGKEVTYELKRQYPYGESLSFISGYTGKVSQDEIKLNKCNKRLNNNELIGRTGAENYFDCSLRGEDGKRLVEVDARGKYVRDLGMQEPVFGEDLNLSVDAYWQDKIYKILDKKKATVIMSEPKTGKIISMVSSPGFDPNVFSYQKDDLIIQNYLNDKENLPLLNRNISAYYYPGSTFKMILATAGLESGVINKDSKYEDTGILKVGDYSYSNWLWTKSGTTDGILNVTTAIKRSNDIFFYKLGGDLGVDRIKEWSVKYGFGAKTGIELPGELTGNVPDQNWKKENKGENWYLGDTYHLSIGQGFLSATPLQVNQMTDTIANHGIKCKMSLLKDKAPECQNLGIKRENWETIIEGMKEACHTGGTAWPLFNFKTELACKTGTAEVGDGSKDTHAWLTVFAPADDPQIAVTVMVERGGEGSDVAAPIAGDILKEWFNEPNTVVPRYVKF
jgi:penicillin-binding protein 2